MGGAEIIVNTAVIVGSSLLGAAVGWAASALTLHGRVTAIEAGFSRIERLLIDHLQWDKKRGSGESHSQA